MTKLLGASLLLFVLVVLQSNAFAKTMNCKFKSSALEGVKSIQLSDESLVINSEMEIPLSKSRVKCGKSSRHERLDGFALGYQVVLKSCIVGEMEGHLIDSVNAVAAVVACDEK